MAECPPTPMGDNTTPNQHGSEPHRGLISTSIAEYEEKIRRSFSINNSIKSRADYRANNPKTKHALNQINTVVNSGGNQVIKIPGFGYKFCNKTDKQRCNLKTHREMKCLPAIKARMKIQSKSLRI